MDKELSVLYQTHTWDITPLPTKYLTIGFCWFYKIKTKSGGLVERYKDILFAKGYSQNYVMDHEETFALVAKMTTIRTLIGVSSVCQWKFSK